MLYEMLKSKIHQATVTDANVHYEGSIAIDAVLLEACGILNGEKVLIANLANGSRVESYAIEARRGSGTISLNGGAAKHGKVGDQLIIMSFCFLSEEEVKAHVPKVIRLGAKNEIIKVMVGSADPS